MTGWSFVGCEIPPVLVFSTDSVKQQRKTRDRSLTNFWRNVCSKIPHWQPLLQRVSCPPENNPGALPLVVYRKIWNEALKPQSYITFSLVKQSFSMQKSNVFFRIHSLPCTAYKHHSCCRQMLLLTLFSMMKTKVFSLKWRLNFLRGRKQLILMGIEEIWTGNGYSEAAAAVVCWILHTLRTLKQVSISKCFNFIVLKYLICI